MIRAVRTEDAAEILAIYSPFITNTAVSFEYEVPSVDEISRRISDTTAKYPWVVWEENGRVLGYAYASSHRARPAYQWSVEVSVYLHPDARRKGIATLLYHDLFDQLRSSGFYNAYAGITLPNEASVGFHESLGFAPIGVYPRIGYKHGKWHDVGWWRLRLREDDLEPSSPR